MESRVFVTQIPNRRDNATGAFTPTINIDPATEHGDVTVMMPARASFHATGDLVRQLKDHLRDYDYERGDSLVALGDPSIIGAACALLGKLHGEFIMLKWDRKIHRYVPTHISVR